MGFELVLVQENFGPKVRSLAQTIKAGRPLHTNKMNENDCL